MKEKELIALGFQREDVNEDGHSFYYFDYDFGRGFSLISSSSNELVDGKWFVEVFESENIRFTNITDVITLIDLIKRNTIK